MENGMAKKNDIFKGLTHEQYDAVMRCGFKKSLPKNTILFHQGDYARKCYLVEIGKLKLTKVSEHGREVIIRYIYAGELTAAVSVLKDQEYPVTAVTIENTKVIGWDKTTILSIMERNPGIAIRSLMAVLERLQEVQNRYLELCTERVEKRVAQAVLRLSKAVGVKTSQGVRINIPLSRQNIADYTGTTIFTASRILSEWEKKGWIESEYGKITITDPHSIMVFSEKGW